MADQRMGSGTLDVALPAVRDREQELVCASHPRAGLRVLWDPQAQYLTVRCRKCLIQVARIEPRQTPH